MREPQLARFDEPPGPLPLRMASSQGTAKPLVKLGAFGADLIRFAPGHSVATHVHDGDHVLLVVSGRGWLNYDGRNVELSAGIVYLVPGSVPHSIGADTEELTLVAVANDHRDAGSAARLELTRCRLHDNS